MLQWMPRPGRRKATRRGSGWPRSGPALESLESRELLTLTPQTALGLGLGVNPNLALPSVSVAIDDTGATYLAGTFTSQGPNSTTTAVNFNPKGTAVTRTSQANSNDIFVAKYNASGVLDWVQTFGDTGSDAATGVAIANGKVFVSGEFTGNIDFDPGAGTQNLTTGGVNRFDGFVLSLNDSDGSFSYVSQIAGGMAAGVENLPVAIAADSSGNAYVTGSALGTVTFGSLSPFTTRTSPSGTGNEVETFVAKLNTTGTFLWADHFTGSGTTSASGQGKGIAVDSGGNVVTTGRFSGSVNFYPNGGTSVLTTAGGFPDVFISKLDSGGHFVWAKQVGGSDFDVGEGVGVDSSNNVFVTGKYTSPKGPNGRPFPIDFDPGSGSLLLTSPQAEVSDLFTLKLDGNGNFQWVRTLNINNDPSEPGRGAIAVMPDGTSYTTGSFLNYGRGNDVVLFQLSSTGTFLGLTTGGSTANDVSQGIAVNSNGRVAISGQALGTATIAGTTLPSTADTFLALYDSNTNHVQVQGDYDGDGKTDPTVFDPRTSTFYISRSSLGNIPDQFGQGSYFGGNPIPIPADYDGDGRTDPSVFDLRTATSYLSRSALGNVPIQFGQGTLFGGHPIPIPADYDGDGKTDVAVFEPSTSTTYIAGTKEGNVAVQFGQGTLFGGHPIPIPADYDGDGKTDVAVFEPSTSTTYIAGTKEGNVAVQFGQGTNFGGNPTPVPADYDGDGKTDVAVFEPSTSTTYIAGTKEGNVAVQFGQGTLFGGHPIPIPADYDGDGKTDVAVFEPSTSTTYIAGTKEGNVAVQFGQGTNFGGNPIARAGRLRRRRPCGCGSLRAEHGHLCIGPLGSRQHPEAVWPGHPLRWPADPAAAAAGPPVFADGPQRYLRSNSRNRSLAIGRRADSRRTDSIRQRSALRLRPTVTVPGDPG